MPDKIGMKMEPPFLVHTTPPNDWSVSIIDCKKSMGVVCVTSLVVFLKTLTDSRQTASSDISGFSEGQN